MGNELIYYKKLNSDIENDNPKLIEALNHIPIDNSIQMSKFIIDSIPIVKKIPCRNRTNRINFFATQKS